MGGCPWSSRRIIEVFILTTEEVAQLVGITRYAAREAANTREAGATSSPQWLIERTDERQNIWNARQKLGRLGKVT